MAQDLGSGSLRSNGHGNDGGAKAFSIAESRRAEVLRELLEERRGQSHVVAIQDFPDPDAISSALAYREIARHFDIDVDIMYEGLISHPENLALVNLLEIKLCRFGPDTDLGQYDAAVFVDNQGSTTRLTERLEDAEVPTFAVVDHHDPQEILDPVFSDVRPLAAAATQMAEYLSSGIFFQMDASNGQHVQLATALLHGLHSETSGFIHAERPEYQAAEFLSSYIDHDLLQRVLCIQKSRGTMETIRAALENRIIRGGISIAGVGYVRWPDRDAIPQATDFLLNEENVHTAIVYGIVSGREVGEAIMGSLRTNNATMGVDAFLKQALGKDANGRFYGGGRSRAGGFEIEMGFLAGGESAPEEREAKWELYEGQVQRRLFEAAGLEIDEETSVSKVEKKKA